MTYFIRLIFSIFIFLGLCFSVSAKSRDALRCLEATRKVENEYNLPPHILSAIALTESGRTVGKMHTPWPWTANIQGKGRYFATKQQALVTFKRLVAKKNHMFDVGCMQINWHYHKDAFDSLNQALTPYENVKYAAEFLRSLYDQTGSWPKAVERYHSNTPKHYNRYRKVVADNWIRARNLMSPVDGKIRNLFAGYRPEPDPHDYRLNVRNTKKKRKKISQAEYKRRRKIRLARMREIAKLRARVRDYAYNDY